MKLVLSIAVFANQWLLTVTVQGVQQHTALDTQHLTHNTCVQATNQAPLSAWMETWKQI